MLVLEVSLSAEPSISSNRPCEASSSSRPFPLPLGGRRRWRRGSGDGCRARLRFNGRIGETVSSSSELGVAERALPFPFDFIRPRALDKASVSTSSPSEFSEATVTLGAPPLPLPTPLFLPLPLVGARTGTTDRDVEAIETSLLAVTKGDCGLISSGWWAGFVDSCPSGINSGHAGQCHAPSGGVSSGGTIQSRCQPVPRNLWISLEV